MSARDFDAVFYVKNVPGIHTEDGLFHICYDVGRAHFEFVMRPSIYAQAVKRAGQVSDEFHEQHSVVAIGKKRSH